MDKVSENKFVKIDEDHGIVFGWGIICKIDGVDYFDTQGDHIPEDTMLTASVDFQKNFRTGKAMHRGEDIADIAFLFPMTSDIAKAFFDIEELKKSGLMIGWKPHTPELLEKYRSGEWTGFSIGGDYGEIEEIPDA